MSYKQVKMKNASAARLESEVSAQSVRSSFPCRASRRWSCILRSSSQVESSLYYTILFFSFLGDAHSYFSLLFSPLEYQKNYENASQLEWSTLKVHVPQLIVCYNTFFRYVVFWRENYFAKMSLRFDCNATPWLACFLTNEHLNQGIGSFLKHQWSFIVKE